MSVDQSRRLDWLLPDWLENVGAYSQTLNEDLISVYYTFMVNLSVFILCAICHTLLRQSWPKLYTPKADMFPDRVPPPIPRDTYLGWIQGIIDLDDKIIIEKGGYDILFLIRFYRLGFKILGWSSIYCLAILVPINGTGNPNTDAVSFDRWSMTNIQQESSRCWFHLIGIYIFTGITFYFLEREFVIYAKYRHIYLRQTHAHLRTVMIEGIPSKFRSPVTLTRYLNALYPNSILHVKIAQNLKYLDSLIVQRENVVALLERAMYDNHNSHIRPMVRVGNMLNDVDAIRYYSQQLDDLNILITKEQKIARNNITYGEEESSAIKNDPKIIDEFLKLTEIGTRRKNIPDSKTIAQSAVAATVLSSSSSSSAIQTTANYSGIYSNINIAPSDSFDGGSDKEFLSSYQQSSSQRFVAEEGDDDSDGDEDDGYKTYRMSWREWFYAIWMAPSLMQGWRVMKQGRTAEDYHTDSQPGDTSSLIQPPEERRLFLAKAFVTFKTFTAATTARQVVHMQLAGRMSITEAPEPTDITWSNLYTSRKASLVRHFIVQVAVFLLIIVWIAPVTLLSFLFSEDALRSYFPWVDRWCDKSQIFLSIIELFQPLALVGIMNLLPPILTFLAVQQGCIAFSVNQMVSFDRYFTFQIINVFLVTTIAGSFVDVVEELYNDPASTFALLGSSLPKMGGFFMNYMLVKALTGLGMELMRFPALFSFTIKTLFTSNVTPRERKATPLFGAVRNPANPGWFPYAKIYAQDMLLFTVAATFACISPLVIIGGLMYYGGAQFVYRHQMMYVYEPIFETGGKWWPKMAHCFIVALLFAQATMVGMMILKETYSEIYFLAILFAVTAFYYYHAATLYEPLANQLPLDMAMAMDRELANLPDNLDGADDYLQPSIRAGIEKPIVEFSSDDKKELASV